jgi:glycosyltransferase involved in cell wall biosynthesis
MKIAIANNLYFPFNRGGAEQIVAENIKKWRDAGHEVFLITTRPSHEAQPAATDLKTYWLKSGYYNLSNLSRSRRLLWQAGHLLAIKKYYQIKKILRVEKPDLLLTHNLMGLGFLLPLAARRLKIRHEHFLHDVQLIYPTGLILVGQEKAVATLPARAYQTLTRAFFAAPAKIISPSRWLLDEHLHRGFFPGSLAVVEPWPDPNVASRSNRSIDNATTADFNFLFVGQIEEHKGILFLIAAWQKMLADTSVDSPLSKRAKLLIVGLGTKLAAAKKLAAENKQIEFLGYHPAEIPALLAKSRYLIIPSLCYENSPTVIRQAHAAGLPVLAAAIGGIPEILKPTDVSFSAGDQADLLNKLNNILAS